MVLMNAVPYGKTLLPLSVSKHSEVTALSSHVLAGV